MVRVLMSGCAGRMGQVITQLAAEDPQIGIVAGVDVAAAEGCPYPVFASYEACDVPADVIIDFSSPRAFDAMIAFALRTRTAAVVCTTGLGEEQLRTLEEASKQIAVLRSANMSLGINLLMRLLKQAAPVLAQAGFDIEIVEQHHKKKKDAPSGTAIALADSINEGTGGTYTYTYDRSPLYEERREKEIGISSVRGGTIVGIHDVLFAGTDEVVELRHTAYSRAIFAKGAMAAAKFLRDKKAGYYQMSDVIEGQVRQDR